MTELKGTASKYKHKWLNKLEAYLY